MICRWNAEAADLLPRGIRSCYKAIYTSTNEIASMVEEEHGFNPVKHLKNSVCYKLNCFSSHFQFDEDIKRKNSSSI
jgi:hypothetical protein